ncbi:Ada metal-binding domain-containing protein [Herbiconiux flava]|uniref:DNA-3-methyladenine glycosylase II n=1 Tax=Herbiconiux flava TaxID=881268 RepID=A0A852SQV9_9MICO|nr:Ada metal-binding domain-containing protein [Herbiconiux flava]NYD71100.1 AraC family transcriptional regulator of adaptative response / DNA-3-methyladenine glycosylase II [Herbiconiux flava]GLK18938.1 putative 3-methyladenine DNA glycosylase AlkA [Herbiconiux flava]
MDFAERYRIISSRDPRFDGQFITAVRSTGIYCRPSCPARTPKEQNVTFYETSAAAHEAGYRACKRCLPEAVPGTPAWNLRDDLAGRSMRLISDGVVEREGVDGLARRLGYSTRHLARVLTEELGAGPLALSRAHRAQTARTLLTSTDLPMADIAFAAGFSSIRQFNDTVAEVFQLTPTSIRERQSRHDTAAPGSITLSLPYREPLDIGGLFVWLAVRAIPGVEHLGTDAEGTFDSYSRSLALPGGPAWFTVRRMPGGSSPRLLLDAHLTALGDLPVLVSRIRRLFDLDADPVAIDEALSAAAQAFGAEGGASAVAGRALAARVAATPGIRMPGAVDPAEMLFRAIVGQQITVVAARTLLHRLTLAAGSAFPAPPPGAAPDPSTPTLLFPTPAQIAEHAGAVLTGPRAKIATVVNTAELLASGALELSFGDDAAEQRRRLVALPGIGDWTAGYLAMRVLKNPDVLPTGDVALRTGARRLGFPDAPRALAAWATPFAPWRTYLSLHLWSASAPPPRPPEATPTRRTTATAATRTPTPTTRRKPPTIPTEETP